MQFSVSKFFLSLYFTFLLPIAQAISFPQVSFPPYKGKVCALGRLEKESSKGARSAKECRPGSFYTVHQKKQKGKSIITILSAGKRTRFTENRLTQDCILLEKLTCRSFLRTGKGYSVRFFSASARIAARSSSVNSPRRYSMNWRSALPRQRLKRGTFMVKPNCSIS